ncbi:uncharacterized protein [Solanum tuberosum]|uniref:uncharacterized protein n=1 Tax=Solanum tuberosum TaxID=4113 RepID=UPI00073A0EC7|nr:PREDICTED: uncharacterized protein LOC107059008 [Solanum tuberosum]
MEKGKAFGTPMSPSTCLESDTIGKSVDEKLYRGMIGSLLYLTASRPDIMFSVWKCTRFQSAPKESHLTAVIKMTEKAPVEHVCFLENPLFPGIVRSRLPLPSQLLSPNIWQLEVVALNYFG